MTITSTFKLLYKHPSVKSVGIYTFSNFFAKIASFLLLFVFTNPVYITPSENGLLSLFGNSMIFLMPFLSLGILHSTSAEYYKLDKKEFKNFFSTGFIMPLIVMIFSMGTLYYFRSHLQAAYGFPPIFTWVIPIVTFLVFCNEQLLCLARNNNEPNVYLKANVSKIILELGLSFILVVFFAARWKGRLEGIFIAYLVTAFYAFYYFNKKGYLFGSIQKKYIFSELQYALPVIALQASIFSLTASDKFFLSAFSSDHNETVGIYSVACVFASVVTVLSMALIQYIFPKIYSILSKEQVNYAAIKKLFLVYLGIMTLGLIAIIIATPLIYHLFIHEKYHPALQYNSFLCVGYYFWAISYFFYAFLLYHKLKTRLLILSISCIAISVGCNYFFISRYNAQGAAIGVFAAYLLVLIITLLFTSPYWKKMIPVKADK